MFRNPMVTNKFRKQVKLLEKMFVAWAEYN